MLKQSRCTTIFGENVNRNMHKEENNLISRYLQGEATEEEIKTLFDWVDSEAKNREELIMCKKVWALSAVSTEENSNDYKKLQFKIKAFQNKYYSKE